MKVRLLVALAVAGVAAFVAAGSAGAAADSTCPGGILASGIYNNVVVTGTCKATGEIWIKGNLTVNGNSAFDAEFGGIINGNVQAWPGSVLLLDGFSITHGVSASGAQDIDLEDNDIGQGVLIQGGGGPPVGACNPGMTFRSPTRRSRSSRATPSSATSPLVGEAAVRTRSCQTRSAARSSS